MDKNLGIKDKKKMLITLLITFLILMLLMAKIAFIQFVQGKWLQTLAIEQQMQERN